MIAHIKSPYIRLSEILADFFDEDNSEDAKAKLSRLAGDCSLEVHGRYVSDFTTNQDLSSGWSIISPQELCKVEWDWENNRVYFDPNDVPEGFSPDYSCYIDVSFSRTEIEELLTNEAPKNDLATKAKPGAPSKFNWDQILVFARALAKDQGFTSQNKFLHGLALKLEEEGLKVPADSSLKAQPEIMNIARQFRQH
ncbi:hypothetical protein [Hyphococcus sp. DH-69]|uniref:hypothetical protein n=1 Tax=Hyphococcus formosus TaxID=3143534 RepID=UPI00398A68EF